MSHKRPPTLDIPLFSGHGTSMDAAYSQAREDAKTSAGMTLLAACHEAFHAELGALPPSARASLSALDLAEFDAHASLLTPHPVLSGASLFLAQALRYLAHVLSPAENEGRRSVAPFKDALGRCREVLGFSSGVLPACVVAASPDLASFLANAVAGFRVALWIGVRLALWREEQEKAGNMRTEGSWALALRGVARAEAEALIRAADGVPPLYITATTAAATTVSGHPAALSEFAAALPHAVHAAPLALDSLYHAPVLEGVRTAVSADLAGRAVRFPEVQDLRVPIRCTCTGDAISASSSEGAPLVARVLDMILTQPVSWDAVTHRLRALPNNSDGAPPLRLLGFGPGTGLLRATERALGPCVAGHDASEGRGTRDTPGHVPASPVAIAIVGMAATVPGAASAAALWTLLQDGVNTAQEIPEHRFKVEDYAGKGDEDKAHTATNPKRQMRARTGNFLAAADEFDHAFFKISPREARSMDPQQRVLLHTAHAALEDAGYVPHATPSSDPARFGVYVGAATGDYVQNLREEVDVYYSTGTLRAFLSGRISYAMQLGGPSMVVDTACSSSSVALYQGVRALMNDDCAAALVGGVNVISSPDMYLGLDRGHFLSPTGQCKAFDAAADGYSRAEGCALFVLKRLPDAVHDGDNILGLIRGVEVNQSGAAHSITYPHAPTQAALLRRVLARAGMPAARVNVVEAHGTGTQAGDPNEVASIRSVLAGPWRVGNPLHITSVKANIGHLEAASGAAGLAKLLLMLQHRRIPRQISLKTLNPRIAPLEDDHTVIPTEELEWTPAVEGAPRVALLNNFGAAGSNCAVLVEEYVAPRRDGTEAVPAVMGLSAKTRDALEELRARYLEWLPTADAPLADIAYSATARRQIHEWRLAVVASDHTELAEKLARAPVVLVSGEPASPTQVVFVFSGQGGQYLGMGRTLYENFAIFRACIDDCEAVLVAAGFPGVRAVIVADERDGSGLGDLEEIEVFHAAVVALECALAQLWISLGVVPAAVLGHSLGEYAALVTAGVLTLQDALLLVATRARLMARKCTLGTTGMLAVNLGPEAVAVALRSIGTVSDVTIACYNSPADCVLSGPLDQLQTFKAHIDARCMLLGVQLGYHSAAMTPLLADLTTAAQRTSLRAPTLPVVSNVFGTVVAPGDTSVFTTSYFARHCSEPVRFSCGVAALLAFMPDVGAWVELGPHTTCLPMLKANPALPASSLLLPSLRRHHAPAVVLARSLAALYTSSLARTLRWRTVFAHLPVRCVSLPSYPLAKTKFWVPFVEYTLAPAASSTIADELIVEYTMLHRWAQYPAADNDCTAVFETPIEDVADAIAGHRVAGMPLCPASVYIELVLAGVELAACHLRLVHHDSHVVLRRMEFVNPLVYDSSVKRVIFTRIKLLQDEGTFTISSRVVGAKDDTIHARGKFKYQVTLHTTAKFVEMLPLITQRSATVAQPQDGAQPEVFSTRTAYEVIFPRVVEYAKEYHTMQTISVDTRALEGCATVQLPADYVRGRYIVHPVWMDTLLHVAGFVANLHGALEDAYICTQIDVVEVLAMLVDSDSPYLVYCTNAWLPEADVMLAEAYAMQVTEPRRIVAHMKGIQFRRARLSSFKKSLILSAGRSNAQAHQPHKAVHIFKAPDCSSPLPDVDAIVLKLVSDTCAIHASAVDVSTDLASIGVDSMMSIEIVGGLRTEFPGLDFDPRVLSCCFSISDICRAVQSQLRPSTPSFGLPRIVDEDSSSPRTSLGMTQTVSEEPSSPRTLLDEQCSGSHLVAPDGAQRVMQILSGVLEVSCGDLCIDTDLDALGLDSLAAIEALYAIRTELGLDLPSSLFATYSTPRALQSYIFHLISATSLTEKASAGHHIPLRSSRLSADVPSSMSLRRVVKALQLDTIPVPIQPPHTSTRLPLFFIHDGSGLVNYYNQLPFLNRAIWGIPNPRFASGRPWGGLVEMAAAYVEYILSETSGPLLLGGWSFGGVVAYEIALQLTSRGIQVKGILLIDSPSPINHNPLSDALIDTVLDLTVRAESGSELGALLKMQFTQNTRVLGAYVPHATASVCPPLVLLRSSAGFRPSGIASVDVPAWLGDRSDPQTSVQGWQRLAHCAVKVLDIPGDHFQAFHASNIAELSLRIADGCEYLENF
ncbi:putative polyketide synthase [Mycena belliarum]|uniref:Polyketide synthase n=1 Tax=Mycena belliarum TaxID=1033014 RepID=A0AAD6U954_9AGAR|nr:putative polyketide synthase [Mycena belliae]